MSDIPDCEADPLLIGPPKVEGFNRSQLRYSFGAASAGASMVVAQVRAKAAGRDSWIVGLAKEIRLYLTQRDKLRLEQHKFDSTLNHTSGPLPVLPPASEHPDSGEDARSNS